MTHFAMTLKVSNVQCNLKQITSLPSLAIAIDLSGLYLIGAPPSCMSVPYAVGVKNAGIPAPPALNLSAKVPCPYNRKVCKLIIL